MRLRTTRALRGKESRKLRAFSSKHLSFWIAVAPPLTFERAEREEVSAVVLEVDGAERLLTRV